MYRFNALYLITASQPCGAVTVQTIEVVYEALHIRSQRVVAGKPTSSQIDICIKSCIFL